MARKTLFIFGLLSLGMFVATGCQLGEDQKADPLRGSTWELFAYRKTRPIEGTLITAEFRDGQVRGTGGCNT